MKKILFPLQKLAMLFFYLELIFDLDKITYFVISSVILGLSLKLEGARPYTPLLFLVVILQMFNFTILQVIVIIIAGIAGVIMKLYEIKPHVKGPFLMGHRYKDIQINGKYILVSIFYPTLTKTKKVQWIPKQRDYSKVLYEIFHVDPKVRRIPYQIFKFSNSYIHKIFMPAQSMSPYITQQEIQSAQNTYKDNLQKIIIFSHGLGAHLNAYAAIYANWVSLGYTVLSLNHDNDVVCLNHKTVTTDDNHTAIKQYFFKNRNKDLKIRVNEVVSIIQLIQNQNFMRQTLQLDKPIKYKQIIMGGHSFGGGTALATKAFLNQKYNNQRQKLQKFTKLVCLDPWLFPFQQSMFDNLHNENILIINSQYFYQQVPYIYNLQILYSILLKNNPQINAFMIQRMDHIAQSDMAYVFGNILQITGTIKLHKLTDKFMALNIFICALFLQGKTKQEILQYANKFIQDKKMHLQRVEILEEYRVTRQLTFGRKQTKEQHDVANKV